MKKIVFVVLLAISILLIGCERRRADPDPRPEISVLILDRGRVRASEGSIIDNRWTRWINENAPVRVRWVSVPRTESVVRLNALFAAGAAPDLVWEGGKRFWENLLRQGVIQPVDEHIRNYSTVYREFLERHPELMPFLVAEDGRQYGMTVAGNILTIPNHAMWIRQDWLDKFGMDTPRTTAEVVEFMRRVRDEDPDNTGLRNFGMTFNFNKPGILRALFGEPFGSFMVVDGHFVDWTSTQGYRDYLEFRAMLFREGFIDPEFITDPNFTRQRQLLVTGRSGIHLGMWDMPLEWRELRTNVPHANWQPLEPWETTQGRNGLHQEPPVFWMAALNTASTNAEHVMAFIDWMMDEGWFTIYYGFEGVHHRLVDGIPQAIDPDRNAIELDYAREFAIFNQDQPQLYWFPIMAAEDPLSQEYAIVRKLANETQLRNRFRRYVPFLPSDELILNFYTETLSQIQALETNIVMGRLTVDEGIRRIHEYKRSMGWDAVKAANEAWLQRNKHLVTLP